MNISTLYTIKAGVIIGEFTYSDLILFGSNTSVIPLLVTGELSDESRGVSFFLPGLLLYQYLSENMPHWVPDAGITHMARFPFLKYPFSLARHMESGRLTDATFPYSG